MRLLSSLFLALTLATTASAQPSLAGKWKITWPAPGMPNFVTLAVDRDGVISGTYASDDGEKCPVRGILSMDNTLFFTVNCAKFMIQMDGAFSKDNDQEITGTYGSMQFPSGDFTMEKQVCLLPEGCK